MITQLVRRFKCTQCCRSLPEALLGAPVGDPSSGLLGFFAPPAPRGEAPRLVTVIALRNPESHIHPAI